MHDLEQSPFQEVLNEISFSRFCEKVDTKIWRVHLLHNYREHIRNQGLRFESEDSKDEVPGH